MTKPNLKSDLVPAAAADLEILLPIEESDNKKKSTSSLSERSKVYYLVYVNSVCFGAISGHSGSINASNTSEIGKKRVLSDKLLDFKI